MGGLLDRIESLSPQGKTYSVAGRSNDPLGSPDLIQTRHRGVWGGALENGKQILSLSAIAYWLSEHNVWEPVVEGRGSLSLFKLINGSEEEFRVTVHRDDVTLEMGTIWLPRVEVVRTDGTAVYWEDTRGRVWGVRFLMEGDTLRFMAGCSSLNLTPRIARFSEGARWVPPIPDDESSGTPNIDTVQTDKQNELDEEDLLDCSLRIGTGWKEGDLLRAVMEGFNSRKMSLELHDLDSLSFTQLDPSTNQELPLEVSPALGSGAGDRDSKISEKSLSNDAMALHYSIDHFTQAFVSETVFKETGIPRLDSERMSGVNWVYPEGLDKIGPTEEVREETESNCDREDVFEPVLIELEEGLEGDPYGDVIYRRHIDTELQADMYTLDEAVRNLELTSVTRPSLPGSRRSSLLMQQERMMTSPESLRASILRQDISEGSSRLSESPSLARYSSLPTIPSRGRLEIETSSEISLSTFQQLTHPDNLIVSSKSGWLVVSKLLSHKKRRLHLSSRSKWKRHWCSVKGASLVLHSREDTSPLEGARTDPLLCMDLEGCLVQTATECFKRNHVFSISLPNGHAYYMQAITQGEVVKWIQQLHCSAAIACTRQLNRGLAVEKLRLRTTQLETEIEGDLSVKSRADTKLLSTRDLSLKERVRTELGSLELSIDLLHAELYRTKCYIASLNNSDIPNPDTFITSISSSSKQSIRKLGLFSACTAYAYICDRNTNSSQQFVLKNSILTAIKEQTHRLSQIQTPAKRKRLKQILELLPSTSDSCLIPAELEHIPPKQGRREIKYKTAVRETTPPRSVEIKYPNGEHSLIVITHSSLIIDVLLYSCINKNLDPQDYYIQLKREHSDHLTEYNSPSEHDYFRDHVFSSLELCPKANHVIDLYPVDEVPLGFSVDVVEKNIYGKFTPSFVVSQVIRGGQADIFGLTLGDELISINSTKTQTLSLEGVHSLLSQESVRIQFRTKRRKLPYSVEEIELINSLICPAPPMSTSRLSTQEIGPLVIPNPKHLSFMSIRELSDRDDPLEDSSDQDLLQTLVAESQALNYSVRLCEFGYSLEEGAAQLSSRSQVSRLTQCCNELVCTEDEFISALGLLIQRYLKPLQQENFVSHAEMACLLENTKQVLTRQNEFYSHLTSLSAPPEENCTSTTILNISNIFIQYSQNFRLFSTFCTSYRNAQELINSNSEEVLAFFGARNPHNRHELRFDSLLALPIQRILRYPLFLRNMRDSVNKGSEEYKVISNAIQIMDRVAGYIDEVQYMSEKFASLFNGIVTESGLRNVGVYIDIAELKHKFDVVWLNPTEETGKWKKKGEGPDMTLFLLPRLLIVISYDNKFRVKLSKHGTVEYRDLEELIHYKLALLLFYCTFKDFPDSDGVSNMVAVGSQGIEQKVTLIMKCKSRAEKAKLIREFKTSIEHVRFN